jgi:hypothetical protein
MEDKKEIIDLNIEFVNGIKNRIYECSDYKNRCDCLLEHDECTYLLDYIEQLERKIKIKDAWANEIKCDLWGYDGCENSIPGLRGLVDEAIDKSEKIINCDDKSIVISGFKRDEHGNEYVEHRNVLGEVLTEFTEEDQKFIDSEEYKRFWFGGEKDDK